MITLSRKCTERRQTHFGIELINNRTDKVIGRIIFLTNSINTIKGIKI